MKKVIALVVAALLVVSGVMIYNVYADKKAQSEKLEQISDRIIELNIQKNNVEKQIEEVTKMRDEELRKGNYMVLFFDDLSENLYTDTYPLLDSYDIQGTIVMKDFRIPGEDDNISKEHLKTILNKGWDLAIGYGEDAIDMTADNAPELLAKYLDSYIDKLNDADIEIPLTFCFNKGDYSKTFEAVLGERGFKIIRHFGETGETYASVIGSEFYYIGSGWCCASTTKLEDLVTKAYEKELTFSISTARILKEVPQENEKVDCTTAKYRRMLSWLEENCPDLGMCTVSELYEKKNDQLTTLQGVVGEYNKEIAEYEAELKKIKDEIQEISSEL